MIQRSIVAEVVLVSIGAVLGSCGSLPNRPIERADQKRIVGTSTDGRNGSIIATNEDTITLTGWKQISIGDQVTFRVPPDMESSPQELPGDSVFHREAYRNHDIDMIIISTLLVPNLPEGLRKERVYSCDTPRYLVGRSSYQETIVEINGRKAKVGIDPNRNSSGSMVARVCFPNSSDDGFDMIVEAGCKNESALATARQIFTSIRFKE